MPCPGVSPGKESLAVPAGTVRTCPGSFSTRSPWGSPALPELLDPVLELSTTSPVTNEGFEAGHFIC